MTTPHWSPERPTTPGRYFYRWQEESGDSYGICLVAWTPAFVHGSYVSQPRLQIQAWCIMEGESGERPNWAYGTVSGSPLFWTEPLVTPDFPAIAGRPPDADPVLVEEQKTRSAAHAKELKSRAREHVKARRAAMKAATDEGVDLHECDGCGLLLRTGDLVVGKVRECPHCAIEFVEGEDGRNCPDCNRPFTSVAEEKSTCPTCLEGGELTDLTLIVKGSKS